MKNIFHTAFLKLLLLGCAIVTYSQHPVAEIGATKFYVYKESIFAIDENKILFSGKVTRGNVTDISNFLVNCKSYTFIKLAHHRKIGNSVSYPPFSQTIQLAKKNAAMEHAINYVCRNDAIKQSITQN